MYSEQFLSVDNLNTEDTFPQSFLEVSEPVKNSAVRRGAYNTRNRRKMLEEQMNREMPLTYKVCFGDEDLHKGIMSKMFVEEPVFIWNTRDFYGEPEDTLEELNAEVDAWDHAPAELNDEAGEWDPSCMYSGGMDPFSCTEESGSDGTEDQYTSESFVQVESKSKVKASKKPESEDETGDEEWLRTRVQNRRRGNGRLQSTRFASQGSHAHSHAQNEGARQTAAQIMWTGTSAQVISEKATSRVYAKKRDSEDHSEQKESLGRHEASARRKKNKKRIYTVSKGISHLSSGRYKPHIKKMLDEAMIDKIVNPHDWLRVYAPPGEKFTAKQTALMERTGLSALQIRHYMHNNSRKAKRILAKMVDDGWKPERTQPRKKAPRAC
jgi:hypothetical protein